MIGPMKYDINVDYLIDKAIKEHCELFINIASNGEMFITIRPLEADNKEEKVQDIWEG